MIAPPPTGQKAKTPAGKPHLASDPGVAADHLRAQVVLARFDASLADEDALRLELPTELVGHLGERPVAEPSLRCDCGHDISIGARASVDCGRVLPDRDRITIGEEVRLGGGSPAAGRPAPSRAGRRGP